MRQISSLAGLKTTFLFFQVTGRSELLNRARDAS